MAMNVLNEKGAKTYQQITFTDKGFKILETFLSELVRLYYKQKKYPFKLGMVLGVSQMNYARQINSKDHLYERIIAYGMLLGLKKIKTTLSNGSELELSLGEAQ
jgi:hypothetical protein